jgi:lantibiotic modifying enzyme
MRSEEPAFLELVERLGREIARSAIWADGRCNWVGSLARDETRMSGRAELAALGPDLYGGTGGVALFLAEASARLGDHALRATALGAIRLALDHADRTDPNVRDGLYSGTVGIAYAAARVAGLLAAEDVHIRARELLLGWRRTGTRSPSSDLMAGCAGAVLGLVAAGPLIAELSLVDAAARLGDELIARADVTPAGWSWPDPKQPSIHNLCGYVHGAAGIGHALAELFGLTGEARFREAAVHAFDYEGSWFDARAGAWPDLRGVGRRAGRNVPMPVSDSWCNGASGIALSRLRAAQLLASEQLCREARIALATCERYVADLLAAAPDDFSLCHGAAGAADVLVRAGAPPPQLAVETGLRGIELFAGTGFPCGVPLGETPGLLLGSSGIGMFYLRLCDSGVQSPLLVHPRRRLTAGTGAV